MFTEKGGRVREGRDSIYQSQRSQKLWAILARMKISTQRLYRCHVNTQLKLAGMRFW